MSHVTLTSTHLNYSSIGFLKMVTEEFEDLKKGQESLTVRVDGIKNWYLRLKKEEEEKGDKESGKGRRRRGQ